MWPFQSRAASRTETGYELNNVRMAEDAAHGGQSVDSRKTGIVALCVNAWVKAFALAQVEGRAADQVRLVLPWVVASIALRGEAVLLMEGGELLPTRSVTLTGGASEASRTYRLQTLGPTHTAHVVRPASGVCHCWLVPDPERPWRGLSPLEQTTVTLDALARVDRQVDLAMRMIPRHLIAADARLSSEQSREIAQVFRQDVESGLPVFLGLGSNGAKMNHVGSLGPELPDSGIHIRSRQGDEIMAAFGIAPALLSTTSGPAAMREAQRSLLTGTLEPLALSLSQEFTRKLGVDVTINLEGLHRADWPMTARAIASLVTAGMSLAEAKALVLPKG